MLGAVQAEHIKVELLARQALAEVVRLVRLEEITLVETELQIQVVVVEQLLIKTAQRHYLEAEALVWSLSDTQIHIQMPHLQQVLQLLQIQVDIRFINGLHRAQ
jgi:hypothetical protein